MKQKRISGKKVRNNNERTAKSTSSKPVVNQNRQTKVVNKKPKAKAKHKEAQKQKAKYQR